MLKKGRSHLKTGIFPGIASKNIMGYREIQLLRRSLGAEAEFITIPTEDQFATKIPATLYSRVGEVAGRL